jgi:hypothetical protein
MKYLALYHNGDEVNAAILDFGSFMDPPGWGPLGQRALIHEKIIEHYDDGDLGGDNEPFIDLIALIPLNSIDAAMPSLIINDELIDNEGQQRIPTIMVRP